MACILLTNDDGIQAEGLRALEECLQGLATIVVVAPDRERSAVSHGLTLRTPLQLTKVAENRYTLNGTPADCVIYSLMHVTFPPPDLVVSGINHGANLGDDIMYSGTVAAAREASKHGIPAIAVSQAYDERPIDFREGARYVRLLVEGRLRQKTPVCLNVNIPPGAVLGVKLTRQGTAVHFPHFNLLHETEPPPMDTDAGEASVRAGIPLDYKVISERYISITPLHRDQTDYEAVRALRSDIPKVIQKVRLRGLGLIGIRN